MNRSADRARVLCAALGALVVALLLPGSVRAEKADHDKPTHIDYDNSSFDDLHQIYVFTGHVILTKGTILIRCDRLVVTRDPENYEFGTATMDAPGKLVYFHQKREGFADQYIEGEGERVEYDEKADLAKIFVRAVVRRLDGGVVQDEIRGDMIQYNSTTEQYVVQAGVNGDRAHALFAPAKDSNSSPTPPNGQSKPGTPAAAGSPKSTSAPATGGAWGTAGNTSWGILAPAPGEPLKTSDQLKDPPDE
jgi:lipopolysaccharide export system protein LptA